jgi:hypothetical protein
VSIATGSKNYLFVDAATTSVATAFTDQVNSPGGSNTFVQFNNNGAFGGIANTTAGFILTSNGTTSTPSFQANTGVSTGKAIAMAIVFG